MKVIVGLGNPGTKYEKTRHNIGFIFCDMFVSEQNLDYRKKFSALVAETIISGEKVLIVKPQTFMNNSGLAVQEIKKFYKLKPEDFLITQDDLDLNFGKLRLKYKSGSGGHNGLKDIINQLQTDKIFRLKIGILNEYKNNVRDFVLAQFTNDEQAQIDMMWSEVRDIYNEFITTEESDFPKIMTKHN